MKLRDFLNNLFDAETSFGPNGLIKIGGSFNGTILNGTNVFVTSSGRVNGQIKTKTLIIAGMVQGNIEAENLAIYSSGRLFYNKLSYKDLFIEEGGVLSNKAVNKNTFINATDENLQENNQQPRPQGAAAFQTDVCTFRNEELEHKKEKTPPPKKPLHFDSSF